jgi:integrase
MIKAVELLPSPRDFYWREWTIRRNKCILSILYYMGLRPKEVTGLAYSDFMPKSLSFLIRGCNNHSHSDRIIPIPKQVFPYLESWLSLGKRCKWLFPSYDNLTKNLSSARWKTIMRNILKESELYIKPIGKEMPRTRSYSLRASFAVRYLKNSNDPIKTMLLLGHNDFRTLKHYVKIAKLSNQENIDSMRSLM